MIILICSQKGGTGKSTIASNFAVFLTKKKYDVILVDCDKQATCANWVSDRDESGHSPPIKVVQRYDNVKNTLRDLDEKYNYVVVDVAGHDSREMRTALLAANLVIIPTKCSLPDLDTLQELEDIINKSKDYNENMKVFSVFSMSPTNPVIKELDEARAYMKETGFNTLQTVIYERKAYRDAIKEGKGVIELPPNKASLEIESLVKEVLL